MRNVTQTTAYFSGTEAVPARLAKINRGLLLFAITIILWGSSVVALQMAGPHAQQMLAGEGLLVNSGE